MTLPRLKAICDSWESVPPLVVSVYTLARAWGAEEKKPKAKATVGAESKATKEAKREGLHELAAMLGGMKQQRAPEWLKAAETT